MQYVAMGLQPDRRIAIFTKHLRIFRNRCSATEISHYCGSSGTQKRAEAEQRREEWRPKQPKLSDRNSISNAVGAPRLRVADGGGDEFEVVDAALPLPSVPPSD